MNSLAIRLQRHGIAVLTALLMLCILCGCATPSQTFALSSSPAGAAVIVNGSVRGYTPVSMNLHWKQNYRVTFCANGYEPYSFDITRNMGNTAWVISEVPLLWMGLGAGLVKYSLDDATGVFTPLKTDHAQISKGAINVILKPVAKSD